jgi:hypothetical protein
MSSDVSSRSPQHTPRQRQRRPTPPRPDDVQNSPLGGVQQLQLASRFRFIESGDGEITASGVQWQPSLRARLLLDADARHTVAFAR